MTEVHLDDRRLEEHVQITEVPDLGVDLHHAHGGEPLAQERGRPVHLLVLRAPAPGEDVRVDEVGDGHLRLVVELRERDAVGDALLSDHARRRGA